MLSLSNSTNLSLKSGSSKKHSLNTIESSVTRLLVSTKHLLESLTQWARQEADDKFVSDAYVKLGNDFRAAARAFTSAGVDISDLGDVPKALRIVLESALSEVPTQESLDKFMPNVRNIIVNLLLTLKTKQLKAKELSEQAPKSTSSSAQTESSTSSLLSPERRILKHSILHESQLNQSENLISENELISKETLSEDSGNRGTKSSSMASKAALAQLQKGNAVLRRASKRFSAYQFAKLANYSGNQLPRIVSDTTAPSPPATKRISRNESQLTVSEETDESTSSSMCLFLRIGDRTKKVEAQLPVTFASIRLLFVEKFAYSPGTNAFPEIYVLDPDHNISFELEEISLLSEVKNGTLLVLKSIEKEVEIKETFQEIVGDFETRLDGVVQKVLGHVKETINNVKFQSTDTANKVESVSKSEDFKEKCLTLSNGLHAIIEELELIKKTQNHKRTNASKAVSELRLELSALKESSFLESGATSNRDYMQHSYSKLSDDSDNLLTKVDDLQDMMEALRKDVAQRGVRIGPQQLKSTRKEIEDAKLSLKGLDDFITDGKPTWKKIWESELDKVCEEQQFFNLQDDLTLDLKEDIKKIEETFDLIEKCSVEQSKNTSKRNKFNTKACLIEPGESMHSIKDAILNQVATLVPNHESRLEAIEKAERLRQKERELVELSEFQEELGDFVGEKRLKNSGGIEEIEKKRQQKDIENLKSSFGVV